MACQAVKDIRLDYREGPDAARANFDVGYAAGCDAHVKQEQEIAESLAEAYADGLAEGFRLACDKMLALLEKRPNSVHLSKCAWCEREFPEGSLNYSSGDPACAACQKVFDPNTSWT